MVRHGQASYMSEDYDRLSTIGEEQAIKLGEFWVRHEIQFDACFQGPAQRHARTAEIAADVVKAAGLPWPEAEIIEDVDEFDAFRLARLLAPRLVEVDPGIRKLNDDFIANRHTPEGGRSLQKLFEAVARMWSSGQYDSPDFESWSHFRGRVQRAVERIRQTCAGGRNVVVITSGGPIAATVAQALDLDPLAAIEFVWLARNCSFAEFLFSGDRFSMHSFNSIPHLDDRRLLTYR